MTIPQGKGLIVLAAAIVVVNGFFPAVWILLTSLKSEAELVSKPITWWPHDPTLANYVQAFGGAITGLRGDDAALEPLLQSLGAARSVQQLAGGDYVVDHSATLFFVDAEGRLAAVFTPPFAFPTLRDDLTALTPAAPASRT